MPPLQKRTARHFTVPEVWRTIVKKNERQGEHRFDVLVCSHAVPANDNTYRRARSCPECRVRVQDYADGLDAAKSPVTTAAARPAPQRRRKAKSGASRRKSPSSRRSRAAARR